MPRPLPWTNFAPPLSTLMAELIWRHAWQTRQHLTEALFNSSTDFTIFAEGIRHWEEYQPLNSNKGQPQRDN